MNVKGYHSHIYFDENTLSDVEALVALVRQQLDVSIGRIIQQPVGPHPMWSCQLAYKAEQLNQVLPWLARQRGDLTVFTHTVTGHDLWDHTQGAIWMGSIKLLNLDMFRQHVK